jgi:hypothetical protein
MAVKRLGMGDSGTIDGAGLLLVVAVPSIAGAVVGALVGGPQHRVLGGALGFGAGIIATQVFIAVVAARSAALMNAPPVTVTTLKNPGNLYLVSSTTGGDAYTQAMAAGFHVDGSQQGKTEVQAVWQGANGAAVPAGLLVKQSAALAQ